MGGKGLGFIRGFRANGLGLRIQDSGFTLQGLRFILGFKGLGFFRAQGSGFRVYTSFGFIRV